VKFYVGVVETAHAPLFPEVMLSVNRLRRRRSDFIANEWLMDSGAFTEVARHGGYRTDVADYAAHIRRWNGCGQLAAAVAQDFMCEPFVVARTGLTVAEHQRLTVERFDALRDQDTGGTYVMPVLQGFDPDEYRAHLALYGTRLEPGAWVGVGSVCKRNGSPNAVLAVLAAITYDRPDLRLHGFGLKTTALLDARVRGLCWSADSAAWSYAARREGRNANDPQEAKAWAHRIMQGPAQGVFLW
jgi:hypothetical protein